MALPNPKSLQDFMDDFLGSWAVLTGVSDVSQIPNSDPIVAIAGSNSGSALWLQQLVFALEAFARSSTSTGADLDSWFAQFNYTDAAGVLHGFERPQGSPASVTIAVNVQIPAGQASITIPKGSIFQTQPITVQPSAVPAIFQVETTQDTVVSSSGTVDLLCFAINPVTTTTSNGSSVTGFSIYNNVPPNSFTQQFSPQAGITSVNNPASPSGGTDNASDAQARIDFVNFILSLSDATYAALVAAVEDVAGGLVVGQTFALYDYASTPTFVQPGQIAAVMIPGAVGGGSGSGQYPGANPDNPTMDAIEQALINTEAFGIVGLTYYAKNYPITAVSATFSYSQSALVAANLTVAALESLMTGILQALIPAGGASLGAVLYFSTLVQQWRNLAVTLSGGVISNIVVDVNASDFTFVTTGGGTFTVDKLQPGTPSTLDQSGFLSLATTVAPNYTALALP